MGIAAEDIGRKIASLQTIPTLPMAIQQINHITNDRNSSAGDVAAAISTDQVLSSKILRLVNSPVYGFPGRISTIKHALVLLGFNVVKGLVLGAAVFTGLSRDKERARRLWEHSFGCAILSRRIARELGIADPEEVMVAGLLHDLGKVALAYVAPADYGKCLDLAMARHCHIAAAEQEVLGVDHEIVGGWLAKDWCFPARLTEPIRFHHAPRQARAARDVTATVHLADILSRAMAYGCSGDRTISPLDHEAFEGLRLTMAQIDCILADAEAEYAVGAAVFDVGEGN